MTATPPSPLGVPNEMTEDQKDFHDSAHMGQMSSTLYTRILNEHNNIAYTMDTADRTTMVKQH